MSLATLGFRYTSIFLVFILSSIPSLTLCHSLCLSLFPPLFLSSSVVLCISMSPSVFLLLFPLYPVASFPLLSPLHLFHPAPSIRYYVGSPDMLPASIRHFDSVQLSMIMYCSLNHSFSLCLALLPHLCLSFPLLPKAHMHTRFP